MKQKKEESNLKRRKHEFLLTFFEDNQEYELREINGYILAKYLNKINNKWEVQIYTKESYKKAEAYHNIKLG